MGRPLAARRGARGAHRRHPAAAHEALAGPRLRGRSATPTASRRWCRRAPQVIEPAGTAPGMVVPPLNGDRPTVVVMPGPPRELHAMWPQARGQRGRSSAAVGGRTEYTQRTLRLFGIPESEIAETLRVAEPSVDGLRGRSRSPPACAGARSRWWCGTSRRPQAAFDALLEVISRAPRAHALLHRRLDGRRAGGGAPRGAAGGAGGVVHRRADGGAADRAAGLLGLRGGRGRGLRERGQGRAARGRSRR